MTEHTDGQLKCCSFDASLSNYVNFQSFQGDIRKNNRIIVAIWSHTLHITCSLKQLEYKIVGHIYLLPCRIFFGGGEGEMITFIPYSFYCHLQQEMFCLFYLVQNTSALGADSSIDFNDKVLCRF